MVNGENISNRDISLAFHIGAPNTDNGQLTWSLRKDAQRLLERGIMVRRPGTYMGAINQMLRSSDWWQRRNLIHHLLADN